MTIRRTRHERSLLVAIWSCLLTVPTGCVLIDDFGRFETRDGGPDGAADGGATDSGSIDGQMPDANATDGGTHTDGATGDAGPPPCIAPCIGDLAADFGATQGSGALRWRYLRDTHDTAGLSRVELERGEWAGMAGWFPATGSSPGFLLCDSEAISAHCEGLQGRLLVRVGSNEIHDPVLELTAPTSDTYRITLDLRYGESATSDVPVTVRVSRNSRNDLVLIHTGALSTTSTLLEVDLELLAGDRALISLRSEGTSPAPIGMTGRVETLAALPTLERCLFAATFDTGSPLSDRCSDETLVDTNDGTVSTTSSQVESAGEPYGSARLLDEGHFLSGAEPLDYSGDFTIQLWARLVEPGLPRATLYSDRTISPAGGLLLGPDPSAAGSADIWVSAHFHDPTGTCMNLAPGKCAVELMADRPTDGEWHLYRMVRDTTTGTLTLCIDGAVVAGRPLEASADLTTDLEPHLGRFVPQDAHIVGAIDDVRVFRRALPCVD